MGRGARIPGLFPVLSVAMHYHQTISPRSSNAGDYVFVVSPGAIPASGALQFPFLGDNTNTGFANFTVG